MAVEVIRPSEKPLKNKNYLKDKMANAPVERKEAIKKWERDHPGKPDGYSFKKSNWKSWSEQLYPTENFRRGYDSVCWNDACALGGHVGCSRNETQLQDDQAEHNA